MCTLYENRVDGEIKRATSASPLIANVEKLSAARRIAGVESASMSTIAKNLHNGLTYALRLVSREHILALADQAIVSASGFLTTLLIARWSDSTQLGVYALGLSLVLSLLAFQDSFIL